MSNSKNPAEVYALPDNGIEIGAPSQATSEGFEYKSSLVLASYNIRYAVGSHLIPSGIMRRVSYNFPRPRDRAVIKNIHRAAIAFTDNKLLPRPDILALQEADKETARAGRQHVAASLAGELGQSYVHVSAGLPRGVKPKRREWWLNFEEQIGLHDNGDTGVALLSCGPLDQIQRIDLPWHDCPWRPRLAMSASFSLGVETVRIFNVHIDPHGPLDNQHQQTETVLAQADLRADRTIILGDFNTLSRQKASEIRRLLESHGFSTPFPTETATWRGAGLRFHADWIFVRGLRVLRWGVARPLNVSDHWPIWAEVMIE